jgi:FlaA1/EpsC-like NDP-sugar epimerase
LGKKNNQKANIRYLTPLAVLKDLLAFALAYAISIIIEFNDIDLGPRYILGWIAIVLTILALFVANSYRIVWRYAGVSEVINVLIAHISVYVVLLLINMILKFGASLAQLTLYLFFSMSFSVTLRFYRTAVISIASRFQGNNKHKVENIIIYGAGFTGSALVRRFKHNPNDGYRPVVMLDDDPLKIKKTIAGLRVVGGRESIHDTMRKYHANTIAIAIMNINREELRQIHLECIKHHATVKIVTNITSAPDVLNVDAISLKNINIVDLLNRPEHKIDHALLNELIKDKVIMVTGGAGSIGSEICRQSLEYGCKCLIIYDHFENGMFEINEEFIRRFSPSNYVLVVGTVKDRQKLRTTMQTYKPDVVFHAAAYKHVPMMEINGDEAVKNNIFGTQNVIEQCEESGVEKFILISTDKAVNPANIMGASKRMAELLVESKSKSDSKTIYAAVRFGNVLGSSGSVIPTFIKQINEGGPVTVTHKDMKRYFMTIPEAVRLVMQAGALAKGGEVFVLDMGEPVYIYDLAMDLIRLSGLETGKDIIIQLTGQRPGEKLFEELRFSSEEVDRTKHDGIFVCKLQPVDTDMLQSTLIKLKEAADNSDRNEVEKVIFEMVPNEYRNM